MAAFAFRVESVLCGRGRWPKFANYALLKEGALRPAAVGQEAMDREERSVYDWRVSQLTRLGIPGRWPRFTPTASTGIRSPGWCSAADRRSWPCASPAEAGRVI